MWVGEGLSDHCRFYLTDVYHAERDSLERYAPQGLTALKHDLTLVSVPMIALLQMLCFRPPEVCGAEHASDGVIVC